MNISIIVPVFNSKKYLVRCLDSIIAALKAFGNNGELILVDNGSTDGSIIVLEKYKKMYPNLVIISSCKTKGAAATRNHGVKKSSGKYLWFIDADDTIRDDSIIKLVNKAEETNADLVMLGVRRIYPDKHTDYLSAVCPAQKEYKSRFVRYGLGPVQVLIRRAWWRDNKFRFYEGIIHEDMELMSALILFTERYACVDEPLYNYYQNTGSVLHKTEWDPHYFDIFTALRSLHNRFSDAGMAQKYHDELEWFFIWNLLIDSAKSFSEFREGKVGFKEIRRLLRQYYPTWRKNRFLKQKPLKLRIRVRLNYFKPYVYLP